MKFLTIKFLLAGLLVFCSILGRAQVEFTPNDQVNGQIEQEIRILDALKSDICSQVDALSSDVSAVGDGSLSYPNWVRFYQIAHGLEALNEDWNEAYGQALDNIIDIAISSGATNVDPSDENGKDLLSEIIEAEYLVYDEDIASVCYEDKFGLNSLRKSLQDQEDAFLDQTVEVFNPGDSPVFSEELDDEYWPLLTDDKRYTIENTDIDESMLTGMTTEEQQELIPEIKEIVEILEALVNILGDLHDLFADCAGSATATVNNLHDGDPIPGDPSSFIGYKMKQNGVLIDFANKTTTKIKGWAKLYKTKSNGKHKRDRKNRASIGFCAKEWNACEDHDWPADPGPYVKPHVSGKRGKKKVKERHQMALAIEYSYHYLQFNFGKNDVYAFSKNLFGNTGCNPVTAW